jgi:molybdate transport system substrate-binding protein
MRSIRAVAAFTLSLQFTPAVAGDLMIFALGSAVPILEDLRADCERLIGARLVIVKGTSGETRSRILAEQGDVGIVNTTLLSELEPKGRVVPGTATLIAKTSAGVAVRTGTRLDVSSEEKLKAAISRAASVATVDPAGGSALGKHFQSVADKLGIGDELRAKLKVYPIGVAVGEAIAKGDAEIGIGFIPEFNSVANVSIAGPLPGATDFSSVTTAVILEGARDQAAARQLIEFLRSPAAQKAIQARGMEPQ